jgi:hypothetical protein
MRKSVTLLATLALALTAELPLAVRAAPDVAPALVLPSPTPTPTSKPLKITKQTGAATPQLLNAHFTATPSPSPSPHP